MQPEAVAAGLAHRRSLRIRGLAVALVARMHAGGSDGAAMLAAGLGPDLDAVAAEVWRIEAACRPAPASKPGCASRWCSYPLNRRRGYRINGQLGHCEPCYRRWLRGGRPASGAAPPWHRFPSPPTLSERLEDYMWLRDNDVALPEAAARTGISERTAWRYETRLRGAASASHDVTLAA